MEDLSVDDLDGYEKGNPSISRIVCSFLHLYKRVKKNKIKEGEKNISGFVYDSVAAANVESHSVFWHCYGTLYYLIVFR